MERNVDVAVIHELNTVNPLEIRGYKYFHVRVDKNFRGTAIYVTVKWSKHVTKVPDEEDTVNLEMLHLRISTLTNLTYTGGLHRMQQSKKL